LKSWGLQPGCGTHIRQWKHNNGFRRTNLRGKDNVLVGIDPIATALNLQKVSNTKNRVQKQKLAA